MIIRFKKSIQYILYTFLYSFAFYINNTNAQNTPSAIRHIVSAEQVESAGIQQYSQIINQAKHKGILLSNNHNMYIRVNTISKNLINHIGNVNSRAKNWKWEINVLKDEQTNAFCMPSGKIAVYSGIIDKK